MYLNTRIIGLNQFLSRVYGVPIRLSILLTELGFAEQQIDQLRRNHSEEIVASSIALLKDRILLVFNGDRTYGIVCRRFGLDGRPTETLQVIGEKLGITRERVRQIEKKAIRRCRSKTNRTVWETGLYDVAARLTGVGQSHDAVIPLSLFSQEDPTELAESETSAVPTTAETNIDARSEYIQSITNILRRVSGGVRPLMLVYILYGSEGPLVNSLVSTYEIPEYGIFRSHGYWNVRRMVLDICATASDFTDSDFMDLGAKVGVIS